MLLCERALNSPSRTTLRLLQRATVLTVVVRASRAASLVLDRVAPSSASTVADDDGNPTDDVIDFLSVGEARCELRSVAMFVGCHDSVIGQAVKSPVSSQRLILAHCTVAKQWRLV